MQTKEKQAAAVAAFDVGDVVKGPRAKRITAILLGLAAAFTAVAGIVADGDNPKDAPSSPSSPPTTQLVPFVTTGAPAPGGGGFGD